MFAEVLGNVSRPRRPRYAMLSRGMRSLSTLPQLLDDATLCVPQHSRGIDAVLAWGRKPSATKAEIFAARTGLPLLRVEDGFLRSIGLGQQEPPLSIVVDDLGIYYDASQPSRLERLVQRTHDETERRRAVALVQQWRQARVSKYNHAREVRLPLDEPFVLVVDQTRGDSSIEHGLADASSFGRMLEAALQEHPTLPVLLKVHPDVVAGLKQGHFPSLTPAQALRVTVLAEESHPCVQLEACTAVYTVTSQLGFEALLWGKPVRCFGMPFYAGWGLTQDEPAAPPRRAITPSRTLEDLAHAALIEYPRYIDPETGQRCEVEHLLRWMALQRRMNSRFAPDIYALGIQPWKRPHVGAFLRGSRVHFVEELAHVPANATLAVWGSHAVPKAQQPGGPGQVLHLGHGLLHMASSGAHFVAPRSCIVDGTGLYSNASTPSDLEQLLASAHIDSTLLARAASLRERMVALGLRTRHGSAGRWRRPPGKQRVILVAGQAGPDLGPAGTSMFLDDIELLQAVRRSAPEAWIVYKPHPAVAAAALQASTGSSARLSHCDEVVAQVPLALLLQAMDEVHVSNSLAGFEALLHGRHVHTWGRPFYAGWGLTVDELPLERPRRVTLDTLVAAALVLYPTYIDARSGRFTTPEQALQALERRPAWGRMAQPGTLQDQSMNERPLSDSSLVCAQDCDVVSLVANDYPGTIEVRVEGGGLDGQCLVLSKGSRLHDAVARLQLMLQADKPMVRLFRQSNALRQKEMLDASLSRLRLDLAGSDELSDSDHKKAMRFITQASRVQTKGEIVLTDQDRSTSPLLKHGDVLQLVEHSAVVSVEGEVVMPAVLNHLPRTRAMDYVKQAGGLTDRADGANILVLCRDGSVAHASSHHLRAGDGIMVPRQIRIRAPEIRRRLSQLRYQVAMTAKVLVNS